MEAVPIEKWGKDHFSLLGYVGCRVVDNQGTIDMDHMRVNQDRHLAAHTGRNTYGQASDACKWEPEHGTRLAGFFEAKGKAKEAFRLPDHDDIDCLDDLDAARLIVDHGSAMFPRITLTELGRRIEFQLREHKSKGGHFAGFPQVVDLDRARREAGGADGRGDEPGVVGVGSQGVGQPAGEHSPDVPEARGVSKG